MDIAWIKELAGIVKEYGLTAIEIEDDSVQTKIRIERMPTTTSALLPVDTPTGVATQAVASIEGDGQDFDFSHLAEIKSPIVGVFYASPSPESDPFVSIGSKIKKGDVLCIIEAMKLMNEITAEVDGEIADICVRNGDIAEYGQVLFKVFPE